MFHVYLIDDNTIILQKYEALLRDISNRNNIDISLYKFDDGTKFLAYVDKNGKSEIDLVYLDITMEGLDGFEVAQELRKRGIEDKIIFLTANEGYVFQAMAETAVGYILKNETDDQMFEEMFLKYYTKYFENRKNVISCIDYNGDKILKQFIDIVYINVSRKMVVDRENIIYTLDDWKDSFKEALFSYHFEEVSGMLVNLEYVKRIESNQVSLINGDNIKITMEESQKLKKAFVAFMSNIF